MNSQPLPQVVEFNHQHTVKVINDGRTTRIIATPNVTRTPKYKRMGDLPFTGPGSDNRHHWWRFPKAINHTEAETRGEYFWHEFVRFARGTQKRRADDAALLLRFALEAMPQYGEGNHEAHVFRKKLADALVAHLRVGVDA